jgi:LysR family transcriptional activator of nhaA
MRELPSSPVRLDSRAGGSVARASKCLLLAQPTITSQVHALEDALGEKLFIRSGRKLVLTDAGRVV